ncbi:MAG TPA: DNA repair protein RecO [Phycisphaeraceae bacterium]
MPRFKDQAICIRHFDWSETSQVVVLLTQQHGKVRGLAKGSKRTSPSSVQRFSGGIELLTRGEIVGVIRHSSELATLTEWDLQDDYHHLRRDLAAQQMGLYAADLVNALTAEHDPHPRAFAALDRFLQDLQAPGQRQAALLRFQWDLLSDCGYQPELWQDVHTGQPLPQRAAYRFDPRGGGLTEQVGDEKWEVRRQTVELLRQAASGPVPSDADPDTLVRANRLLCVYVRWILDQELPTMRFVLGGNKG